MRIIVEGKREEVAEKLKQKFEYDRSFIDAVLDTDPTGYKYIDYLAKQLDKYIVGFAGEKGGLNVMQTRALLDVFEDIIPWFHNASNRITPEFLKQARDRYIVAMDRDAENFDSILKSPKDITNYHPYFIQTLKNIVEESKSNKEKEKEAKSQVEKLYEDDEYLVLKPKTYEASCYYGAGTKWCTSSKDTRKHFKDYTDQGELYYFINKKNGNKYALYKDGSSKEIFDSTDKRVTSDVLLEMFPLEITKTLLSNDFFKTLVSYAKGVADVSTILKTEDMISRVIENKPRGSSVLRMSFENEDDFFSLLGVDDDDAWFAKAITSSYSNYEFQDSYQTEEDFKEGYNVYEMLDEENIEKLKLISLFILGKKNFDLSNDSFKQELSKRLLDLFNNEMDYILSDYNGEYNYMMSKTAQERIYAEIENFLENFDFKLVSGFDVISTTVGNLIWWYARLNAENLDLFNLMKKMFESSSRTLGGWQEDQYSFYDQDNFDKTSFNMTVSRRFDDILEKLEDSSSQSSVNPKDFIDMVDRINSKFKTDVWTKLPKDKKINFKIEGFDFDTGKIRVLLNHPKKGSKRVNLSEENFYHLLYQPELFEFGEI